MSHAEPSGECVFCCEELTADNYVEYRSAAAGPWLPSVYCQQCVDGQFIGQQWQTYLDNISKADCAAALRRLITNPPPINVKDAGLPCDTSDPSATAAPAAPSDPSDPSEPERGAGEVHSFWYASDGGEHSAKLAGSLLGDERARFWADKKGFLAATELDEERAKQEAGAGTGGGGAGGVASEGEGESVQQQAVK